MIHIDVIYRNGAIVSWTDDNETLAIAHALELQTYDPRVLRVLVTRKAE